MNKFMQVLKDINELIVFKHSVFVLPFIFMSMIVASKIDNGTMWFGIKLFTLGTLCAVTARNFAMATNRYLDEDIDRPNPRCVNRPSVDGRIGKKNLIIFIVFNAFAFIFIAYFINDLAFKLSFPILIALGGYSFFKRFSSLAHVVLGLCEGLAPIAGVVAVSADIPLWSVLLCFGVSFWVAGFDVLYSLQDIDYDKKTGLFSIPSRYGVEASMFISAMFHFITIIFWLLFAWSANLSGWAYFGIILSAFILFKEHQIVRKDFSKIDKAFFTLNGYLGIMLFIFIWIDLWTM
ncbi:MAG: menaquinone biosynthesis prenyltransferase MqnP [Campylobacter sputorum]|uniref:menaquinone biosynthesis prenyltransferase MqnP n=1 Tax=Campylobacter sputorum TaxID=206 RepID=UPI000B783999|nr:menaquinone biosynthesis prenyltransferase MqnP [Campylobacter sputorum]ASM39043.1 4-hydroxybenzoate octaprenyltransferase [Campylobacter sputorum bv. paraureolyticus LMG 11764]MDY6120347.1 menaquinone biosynthesis prenyltransferase MqnP [Campylobacter sputorum]